MGYPKFGLTLAEATDEARRCNIEKGWRPAEGGPGANSFGDYASLLAEELGEMVSAYRKHRLADATGLPACMDSSCDRFMSSNPRPGDADFSVVKPCPAEHLRDRKPEGVGAEMADIFIRLVGMADAFGIDLEAEYRRKMAHNWTRPVHHGGTMADVEPAKEEPAPMTAAMRFSELHATIPDDPRGWWTGAEVDDFIEDWQRLGMPRLTMQDAQGDHLVLWCTDVHCAAALVDMADHVANDGGFTITKDEYSVSIVQAEKGDRDGRA